MKKIVFLLCLLMLIPAFASCNIIYNNQTAETTDAVSHDWQSEIVGRWSYTTNGQYEDLLETYFPDCFTEIYYVFHEDGSGITGMTDVEQVNAFTYSYNGTTLTLTYSDGTTSSVSCILNGDVMTVSDGGENTLDFNRQ